MKLIEFGFRLVQSDCLRLDVRRESRCKVLQLFIREDFSLIQCEILDACGLVCPFRMSSRIMVLDPVRSQKGIFCRELLETAIYMTKFLIKNRKIILFGVPEKVFELIDSSVQGSMIHSRFPFIFIFLLTYLGGGGRGA